MWMAAKSMNFKTMIEPELKARLDKVLSDKRLSLTDFVDGVVRFYLDQDSLAQSMIAGQVPAAEDLIEIVKFRRETELRKPKKPSRHPIGIINPR